jgi:hypothetical protein
MPNQMQLAFCGDPSTDEQDVRDVLSAARLGGGLISFCSTSEKGRTNMLHVIQIMIYAAPFAHHAIAFVSAGGGIFKV